MSYPILYKANETDFTHLGVGVLSESATAFVVEERNGIFEFEMQYPIGGALFSELKNDRLIKVDASPKLKSQRFKIIRITKPANGFVTVYGEHVSYLAQDLALKPEVSVSGTALSALNIWRMNLVDEHPFTVYSDVQTTGSGKWTIDKVENARRALGGVEGSLLDIYGGEYRFDNYHIGLYSQRGDESEALIAYGKNIMDLTQEEEIASTYTSIYPFAILRDGESEELLTLPEYFVDSEHVSKYARRKIQVVDFSQDEIDTVAKLRTRAEEYIEQNSVGVPKVNLKVKFIDLSKTLDYEHLKLVEEINLCDVVTIYFDKLDIHTKAKVIKVTWDVLAERYEEIEIGEARSSLSNAITNTLDGRLEPLQQTINYVQVAANGKNRIFRGLDQPTTGMSLNDLWYKPVGDGETELYRFDGAYWKLEKVSAGLLGGTLDAENGDVNLINVNVSKIVGDTSEFVRSAWNGIASRITIDGDEILTIDVSGRYVTLSNGGLTFGGGGEEIILRNNTGENPNRSGISLNPVHDTMNAVDFDINTRGNSALHMGTSDLDLGYRLRLANEEQNKNNYYISLKTGTRFSFELNQAAAGTSTKNAMEVEVMDTAGTIRVGRNPQHGSSMWLVNDDVIFAKGGTNNRISVFAGRFAGQAFSYIEGDKVYSVEKTISSILGWIGKNGQWVENN